MKRDIKIKVHYPENQTKEQYSKKASALIAKIFVEYMPEDMLNKVIEDYKIKNKV